MPDPDLKSVSATQTPALFGVSKYMTKWMLYQRFAKGVEIDKPEDQRMAWGKALQPLVLHKASEDLRLEIRPNGERYHRKGALGATRDATIFCPDRGPGSVETKCVFDFRVWMQDWQGGAIVPRSHEIQLQQQMYVGDGHDGKPFEWGVIAAWVCGEMHYFQRDPLDELWVAMAAEAVDFLNDVKAQREPNPFGVPMEVPLLTKLYPPQEGKVLDLTSEMEGNAYAEIAQEYHAAKAAERTSAKTADAARAKLLARAAGAEEIRLPGLYVTISQQEVREHTRKASTRTLLKVHAGEATTDGE